MDAKDYNRIINSLESSGFYVVPLWLAQAIESKNPRLTLDLAHSREYRIDQINIGVN